MMSSSTRTTTTTTTTTTITTITSKKSTSITGTTTPTKHTSTSSSTSRRKKRMLSPQSILDATALEDFLREHGTKPELRRWIWTYLIKKRFQDPHRTSLMPTTTTTMEEIPNVPQLILQRLQQHFVVCTSQVVETHKTERGCKLVIQLQDGAMIETVIIHHTSYSTVCVSSQIGCKMACTFCETGTTLGWNGNLLASEILEQVYHAKVLEPNVRNVVFMGMGEPLDNYTNVLQSCYWMNDSFGFEMKFKRITISTVGIPSAIRKLAVDLPQVHLALSLHAPTTEVRQQIVPTTKTFTVEKIMEAIDFYQQEAGKRNNDTVMMEYIMIDKINSLPEHAHALGNLLVQRKHGKVQVNLIPYNPTDAGNRYGYQSPSEEDIKAFQTIFMQHTQQAQGNFIRAHIRWSTVGGQSINASCGQLALKNLNLNNNHEKGISVVASCNNSKSVQDIEDIVSGGGQIRKKPPTDRSGQKQCNKRKNHKEDKPVDQEQQNVMLYLLFGVSAAAMLVAVAFGMVSASKRHRLR